MKYVIIFLLFVPLASAVTFKNISQLTTHPIESLIATDSLAVYSASAATTRKLPISELDQKYFSADFTEEATFADKLTVESTAFLKSGLILISPDASCSLCAVDNSDTFACAPITCP